MFITSVVYLCKKVVYFKVYSGRRLTVIYFNQEIPLLITNQRKSSIGVSNVCANTLTPSD